MSLKRSPLARHTPLRARPKRRIVEPGRVAWKEPRAGCCQNCGRFVPLLQGHHVVFLQVVRREGGEPWDAMNRMDLCVACHAGFHAASVRIPLSRVPLAAQLFTVQLLGPERGADWLARRYAQ